jgi:hypothetical protein
MAAKSCVSRISVGVWRMHLDGNETSEENICSEKAWKKNKVALSCFMAAKSRSCLRQLVKA